MTDATPATTRQFLESSQGKTGINLSQTTVRANLVNHLMNQNSMSSMSSFPIMISGQTLLASTAQATLEGNIVVPSLSLSGAQTTSTLPGHIVKLTTGGLLPSMLPSVDSAQSANPTSLMCVLTPQPTGLQLTTRGTLQHRLPTTPTVERSAIHGSQTLLPYQKFGTSVERPKMPVSAMTAVTLNRPAVVVQGVAGSPSIVAGLAPGTVRTLIPGSIRVSSATAIPVMRAPVVSLHNRPNLSAVTPGTSNAATIQIAIRGPMEASSSFIPTTTVRLMTSVGPALQPKPMLFADNTSKADLSVFPFYRQRNPMAISSAVSRVTSCATGASQNQAMNLTAKPKVLVSSVPQKQVSIAISSTHVGQPVALNLSQSARPRIASVIPVVSNLHFSGGSQIITGTHSVATKTVSTISSATVVSLPCGSIVTIARPPRPSVAVTSQHRQKVSSALVPSLHSAQLPTTAQNSSSQFAPTGASSMVSRSGGPVALTMDQSNGRMNLPPDRTDPSVQPIAIDYTSHLMPVISRPTSEHLAHQPMTALAMLGSHASARPSPASSSSQPMSFALGGGSHSTSSSVSGTKLSQVVVTMDANRRTTLSLQQPGISVQQQHLQTVVSDSSPTVGQSVMSPPRPTILRKRTYEGNTPKKTTSVNQNITNTTSDSSVSKPDVAINIPVSPYKPQLPLGDTTRENSQSSTDTASSSGSTPRSCPQSVEKIKSELLEAVESGLIANGHCDLPRKKPRKQSLHCNEEMPAAGFSSEEDNEKRLEPEQMFVRLKPRRSFDKAKEIISHEEVSEYCDEDGIRFSIDGNQRRYPGGLVGSQNCAWKSRNSHYLSHNDITVKEERRHTVNELSNSWRINQKSSGWSIYHAADQMTQLCDLEEDVLKTMRVLTSRRSSERPRSTRSSDITDECRVQELILGNVQRCELYKDRLIEAKNALISIVTSHQPRILDIIGRHQSKRSVKKKERL